MIKRIIFDIDYTLLIPNYGREKEFLANQVPKENVYFINHMYDILSEYEKNNKKYDKKDLLLFLNKYVNIKLEEDFLNQWFLFNIDLIKQDTTEVRETLDYLSKYELVTLSNWFNKPQIKKLQKLGLENYFDEFYGGDQALKPNRESYLMACGENLPSECVMVGDNLENDVIGAINVGLKAIHYTNNQDYNHDYVKVKRFRDLKNIL